MITDEGDPAVPVPVQRQPGQGEGQRRDRGVHRKTPDLISLSSNVLLPYFTP